MTGKPDKVSRLLKSGPRLGHLARMAARQQALLSRIRSHLPPSLADHCLHARIHGRELVLHVDSPVWHSRLRFHAPALVRALRKEAPHLERVRIRVLAVPVRQPATRPRSPGGQRRIALDALADEELRRLLKR